MSRHVNYKTPQAVLDDKTLDKDEKIQILTEWADHERQKHTADAENMGQGMAESDDKLTDILTALHTLGADFGDTEH